MVKRRRKAKRKAPRVQAERICSAGLAQLLRGRSSLKCTMGDVVKMLWAHAKANGLSSGGTINCDPAMRRLFGVDHRGMGAGGRPAQSGGRERPREEEGGRVSSPRIIRVMTNSARAD